MSIPGAPDGKGIARTVLTLFGQLHQQLRQEVGGLNSDAVNWVPTPGSNSIATIVTHVVGSEAETLRSLAGMPTERDRDAEFEARRSTTDELLERLDAADEVIAEVMSRIGPESLSVLSPLPTLPAEDVRPGLIWLLGNYGHAREHLGHVQLTRQLYEAQEPN